MRDPEMPKIDKILETINRCVPSQMEVDVGTTVQAMVLDTLSGRTPGHRGFARTFTLQFGVQ